MPGNTASHCLVSVLNKFVDHSFYFQRHAFYRTAGDQWNGSTWLPSLIRDGELSTQFQPTKHLSSDGMTRETVVATE